MVYAIVVYIKNQSLEPFVQALKLGPHGFVLAYYIMTCYGGAFASIPAYIGDIFGTKELGAIHGYILSAWALAGLAGPIIIAYVKDSTGSYSDTLYVFVGLFFVALIISILMLSNIKKIKTQQTVA